MKKGFILALKLSAETGNVPPKLETALIEQTILKLYLDFVGCASVQEESMLINSKFNNVLFSSIARVS